MAFHISKWIIELEPFVICSDPSIQTDAINLNRKINKQHKTIVFFGSKKPTISIKYK